MTTQLRAWCAELRELCPTIAPVVVRRRPLRAGYLGLTSAVWRGDQIDHFCLTLATSVTCWKCVHATLMHEWAHCLAWYEGHETVDDHGPEWALAYARVYGEMIAD
jgi:hypothetical protein